MFGRFSSSCNAFLARPAQSMVCKRLGCWHFRGGSSHLQALEDVDEVGGALRAAMAEKGGCRKSASLLHQLQHRQLLLLQLDLQHLQPHENESIYLRCVYTHMNILQMTGAAKTSTLLCCPSLAG